jgi:hypothetical protein
VCCQKYALPAYSHAPKQKGYCRWAPLPQRRLCDSVALLWQLPPPRQCRVVRVDHTIGKAQVDSDRAACALIGSRVVRSCWGYLCRVTSSWRASVHFPPLCSPLEGFPVTLAQREKLQERPPGALLCRTGLALCWGVAPSTKGRCGWCTGTMQAGRGQAAVQPPQMGPLCGAPF